MQQQGLVTGTQAHTLSLIPQLWLLILLLAYTSVVVAHVIFLVNN